MLSDNGNKQMSVEEQNPNGKEFFALCSMAQNLDPALANLGIKLLKKSSNKMYVCAGVSSMARRGLLKYSVIEDSVLWQDFLDMIDAILLEQNWVFTLFPDEDF